LFTSRNTPYTDLGDNLKIFQKLSNGYQLGMKGMSTPLYEITLTQQDVSGQPVGTAVNSDRGPATNGL
jgi:hypothetical protein